MQHARTRASDVTLKHWSKVHVRKINELVRMFAVRAIGVPNTRGVTIIERAPVLEGKQKRQLRTRAVKSSVCAGRPCEGVRKI